MISVLIPDGVVDKIRAGVRFTFNGAEQGGLLLGYRKHLAIEIQSVSFPSHWDQSSGTQFRRSERGHRVRALREWVRSNHTVDWVGEWHTHLGGAATPSSIDLHTWRRLVQHTRKPMVFIIFSDNAIYAGIQSPGVWRVRHMEVVERDDQGNLFA